VSDTLCDIDALIAEHNITVLLGFSQGGNVVDTYLAYRNNPNIKCAVIMSSYALVDEDRSSLMEKVNIPVLTVSSAADVVVPQTLTPIYPTTFALEHDKGHRLPTKKPSIRKICIFMQTNTF